MCFIDFKLSFVPHVDFVVSQGRPYVGILHIFVHKALIFNLLIFHLCTCLKLFLCYFLSGIFTVMRPWGGWSLRKCNELLLLLLLLNYQTEIEILVQSQSTVQRPGPQLHGPAYQKHRIGSYRSKNSVLLTSVFHRLASNFGFCACVLHVTKFSRLTRLAQKFGSCT